MLESLIVQGPDIPSSGGRKVPRPGTRVRSKAKQQTSTEEQQQQSEKADQKFATELSDEDLSNIWKPSRNNKAGFNALAVDSDGEENTAT
jgi:hypothetical protein